MYEARNMLLLFCPKSVPIPISTIQCHTEKDIAFTADKIADDVKCQVK